MSRYLPEEINVRSLAMSFGTTVGRTRHLTRRTELGRSTLTAWNRAVKALKFVDETTDDPHGPRGGREEEDEDAAGPWQAGRGIWSSLESEAKAEVR